MVEIQRFPGDFDGAVRYHTLCQLQSLKWSAAHRSPGQLGNTPTVMVLPRSETVTTCRILQLDITFHLGAHTQGGSAPVR
jgi:hypothetical protein